MRKLIIAVLAIALLAGGAFAEEKKYEANWDSLNSRPMPQWWMDAKFGIFIHWGPYAVPGFAKPGKYSEWYWQNLMDPERVNKGYNETNEFHERRYGDKDYFHFADLFHNDLFDANDWAKMFAGSGAKYVVSTSKHHDGYCIWPSAEADKSWGRPWNSVSGAPKRDLLGELTKAVRDENLKMGVYYSLYEWYNPLYNKEDPAKYVEEHMIPQFKDLVNNYAPSVIFSDGEWDFPHETWHSTELLAWLFNESPCKGDVVVNDRWGKKCRHKNGDYFTTEYGSGMADASNPWEENRGMGHSFGYNRMEQLKHYHSGQELTYMLIDIVSRGGNFLLDVGPTHDGRIPVIMQERLAEIGSWMDVNGEAIYGTTPWKKTCQWSEGKRPNEKRGGYKVPYNIMNLTVTPKKGMACKEIFFTKKDDTLYAICPTLPNDGKLVIEDVTPATDATIELLGHPGKIDWKQVGKNIEITLPYINPLAPPSPYAFAFKITKAIQ